MTRPDDGPRREPLLDVVGVTKEFVTGPVVVRAVDDVSFDCDRGEITLVMGPSGSGKTTLLTIIGAMLRPTSGRVCIDGDDIVSIDRRELPRLRREHIGFIFQTSNLISALSARENVEIALAVCGRSGRDAERRADELLELVGVAHRSGLRAADLSGGERQRVSIARALANHPSLLLADEPTASLDSVNGEAVMQLLVALARHEDTAVVVVSHDARIERLADRVLQMEDGRLSTGRAP
jgi:putative ABC transport system ATP-binding protein